MYLSLHCHHQFNVSLIVWDKITRHCPQTTIFEEKGELKRIRTEVYRLTARPNRLTGMRAIMDLFIYVGTFCIVQVSVGRRKI